MKFVAPASIVFVVVGATFGIVWLRYDQLLAESEPGQGAAPSRAMFSFAFTMTALLFGIAVAAGFYFATGWWQAAESILLWTAISLTVLFSVGALVVRTQVLKTGAAESIALNLLWGLGYGWVLPTVMKAMGLVR